MFCDVCRFEKLAESFYGQLGWVLLGESRLKSLKVFRILRRVASMGPSALKTTFPHPFPGQAQETGSDLIGASFKEVLVDLTCNAL